MLAIGRHFAPTMLEVCCVPAKVKEARAKSANGEISQDELTRCEDEAIEHVIRKQEEIGLQSVTDGELRREMWHWDFLAGLDGVQLIELGEGVRFGGVRTKSRALVVTEKIASPRRRCSIISNSCCNVPSIRPR